jgi:hypothetical protein
VALSLPGLSAAAARVRAGSGSTLRPEEDKVVAAVRDKAKKAGLGEFASGSTEHFLGLGDAPPRYQANALQLCEAFSKEFLDHLRRERGFRLEFPARRMTVVMLKDAATYKAYSGGEIPEGVGGHYEPDTNQLVVFDFRPGKANLNADPEVVNTFTLVHETAHMVSYNTGLLSTASDLPAAVSEGLATYAERWTKPRDRVAFGLVNTPRLRAIDQAAVQSVPWISMAQLLSDDRVLDQETTGQLAYAEAWLLVHYLLRQPAWLPKFRTYLAGIPKPGGQLGRVAYAESVLGPLRNLDPEIRRYAKQVRARRR